MPYASRKEMATIAASSNLDVYFQALADACA
jgi:hypothetical protein